MAADGPLRELALSGDEREFEALIGPLVEPALRLAFPMLGDRGEAEDVTQEAVTRAWRNGAWKSWPRRSALARSPRRSG